MVLLNTLKKAYARSDFYESVLEESNIVQWNLFLSYFLNLQNNILLLIIL